MRPTVCPADVVFSDVHSFDLARGAAAYSNQTMRQLIALAYSIPAALVFGGPDWLDSERFDIYFRSGRATAPAEMTAILQSLLVERLGLATHREDKPMPAYVLKLGAGKPLLKPSAGGDDSPGCQQDGAIAIDGGVRLVQAGVLSYTCKGATIAALLDHLATFGYTTESGYTLPITDATGLTGRYDFKLKYKTPVMLRRPSDPGYDPDSDISLFDAVEKQLGLKLERTVQPTAVLVVDRVNEKPAPNPPGVSSELPSVPTEFEVANIRPSGPDTRNATLSQNRFLPSGEVFLYGRTLQSLIESIYNVNDDSVLQAPGWLNSDKFDFEVKTPLPLAELSVDAVATQCASNAGPRDTMWKNLLAQRFKLAVHDDVKPIRVFALVAVKGGKLRPADPQGSSRCDSGVVVGARKITCTNTTMAQLANWFDESGADGYTQDRRVVDRTGLTGGYDFSFTFITVGQLQQGAGRGGSDGAPADPTGQQDLFEALKSQLGLKLVEQQQPMPVLVIDHVERVPTIN